MLITAFAMYVPGRLSGSGFTIVELLVTVAIFMILAGLALPGLAVGKERSKRAACASNARQFVLALHLYAQDNNDSLPKPQAGCTALFSKEPLTHFLCYASLQIMDCPNLRARFNTGTRRWPRGWREQGTGAAFGYHYLGGHIDTPWPRGPASSRRTNAWISPEKLSSSVPGPILADLNTCYQGMTIAPHGGRGPVIRDQEYFQNKRWSGLQGPDQAGGKGGNVGSLDGAVNWMKMKALQPHATSPGWGGEPFGWW